MFDIRSTRPASGRERLRPALLFPALSSHSQDGGLWAHAPAQGLIWGRKSEDPGREPMQSGFRLEGLEAREF